MFKKETEYALRALVYIKSQNNQERRPGIVEIASEIEAPQSFTAKILQRLVKNGFLKSQKGIYGGFYFDSKAGDLALKDIIVSIEGETLFHGCGFGLQHCDENNPCPLHESYAPIREALDRLVSEETIQGLAERLDNDGKITLNRIIPANPS